MAAVPPPLFHEFFYRSTLADGRGPATASAILRHARTANGRAGISGLLIFDGQNFLQHFEGPPDAVQPLMARIAADPRHGGLRLIHAGALAARRCARFEVGFAEPSESDEADELRTLDGEAGLQRFLALRPRFDLQG